jgi:hypothetical protein
VYWRCGDPMQSVIRRALRRHAASIVVVVVLSVGGCHSTPSAPTAGVPDQPVRGQAHLAPTATCLGGACPSSEPPLFIIDGVALDQARIPAGDTTSDSTKRFRPWVPMRSTRSPCGGATARSAALVMAAEMASFLFGRSAARKVRAPIRPRPPTRRLRADRARHHYGIHFATP